MKRILLAVLLLVSINCFSQVSFGIKGGLIRSWSKTNMPYSLSVSSVDGFSGGIFANFKIKKHIYFQPELLYSMRGCSYKTEYQIGSSYYMSEATYKYNYIDLPLLVRLSFGEKLAPFINLGISPSYLLSSSRTYKDTDRSDDIAGLNRFNLGLVVSPGLQFKLSRSLNTFIELRYQYGLIDLYGNSNKETNTSVAIYTGISF